MHTGRRRGRRRCIHAGGGEGLGDVVHGVWLIIIVNWEARSTPVRSFWPRGGESGTPHLLHIAVPFPLPFPAFFLSSGAPRLLRRLPLRCFPRPHPPGSFFPILIHRAVGGLAIPQRGIPPRPEEYNRKRRRS